MAALAPAPPVSHLVATAAVASGAPFNAPVPIAPVPPQIPGPPAAGVWVFFNATLVVVNLLRAVLAPGMPLNGAGPAAPPAAPHWAVQLFMTRLGLVVGVFLRAVQFFGLHVNYTLVNKNMLPPGAVYQCWDFLKPAGHPLACNHAGLFNPAATVIIQGVPLALMCTSTFDGAVYFRHIGTNVFHQRLFTCRTWLSRFAIGNMYLLTPADQTLVAAALGIP